MNKPPYQLTTAQMQAQATAALAAQQQAYLHAQQQASQQIQGIQHSGYRNASTQTSGGSTGPTYYAYLGAGGTIVYAAQTGSITSQHPGYGPIEEAGIRAGEIIAYRAWVLRWDHELHSMALPYIWQPGIQKIEEGSLKRYCGNGFHAFKELGKAYSEYPYADYSGCASVVYGEVALWGEVMEHERGYRAECARITRIIEVCEPEMRGFGRLIKFWEQPRINRLRRKYGVEE